MGSLRKWLLILAFCTFMGFLSFSTFYTEELTNDGPTPYQYFLINELSAAYSIFLLLPPILWLIERYPFRRDNWLYALLIYGFASILFGLTHTFLMTVSRIWLHPYFGLDPYSMGDPLFRVLMEYQKQVSIFIVVVIGVHVLNSYRERQKREQRTAELELRAARLQSKLSEAQLHTLKGQLEPHFLFNTLNMISSLMYEDVTLADRMMARLSQLLRMNLEYAGHQEIRLSRELEFLEAYVEIMRCRFQDALRIQTDVGSDLLNARIPSFILQPIVENSIKHGLSGVGSQLSIDLRVWKEESNLVVEIQDNGPGSSDSEDETTGTGLGLSNTRERLRHLYGSDHSFHFGNDVDGGFRVVLRMPFRLVEEELSSRRAERP
jgi:sensor histidine kinase YesM